LLDRLLVRLEELVASRDSGVVDEDGHAWMPLRDGRDSRAVGDVADLVGTVEVGGERAQPVLAPREQHELVVPLRQTPHQRLADAGTCAGHDDRAGASTCSLARRHPANVASVERLIATVSVIGSA
jgi:hypothetical protein